MMKARMMPRVLVVLAASAALVGTTFRASPALAAPPPPPPNVSARALHYDQVEVRWDVTFGHINARTWGFEVYRRDAANEWGMVDSVSVDRTTSVDLGVQPETRYEYAVCAINQDGPDCSRSVFVTTPAGIAAPTGLTVNWTLSTGGGMVAMAVVTWRDPSPEVGYYEVYRQDSSGRGWQLVGSTDLSLYKDDGLRLRTRYDYKVCTSNRFGQRCSGTVSVTTTA